MTVTIDRTTALTRRGVLPPGTVLAPAARLVAGHADEAPGRECVADGADARSREEVWETDGGAGRVSAARGPRGRPTAGPPVGGGAQS